jgi:hypothetical protein
MVSVSSHQLDLKVSVILSFLQSVVLTSTDPENLYQLWCCGTTQHKGSGFIHVAHFFEEVITVFSEDQLYSAGI